MKTMTKRIASMALAVMMAVAVLASALPTQAFAAGAGKLTVTSNSAEFANKQVKIWKMFDMTVSGAGTDQESYGYAIDPDWKDFFIEKSTDWSLGLTESSTDEEVSAAAYGYINGLGADNVAEVTAFAKVARNWAVTKSLQADGTQNASADAPYTATFSNLEYGYYVVSPAAGSTSSTRKTDAMLIPVKDDKATIELKSEYPTVEKTVDGNDKINAEIGKELTFTLKAKVPDVSEFVKYQFAFKDTLSKGLTFVAFDSVTIGGTKLETPKDYTATNQQPNGEGKTEIRVDLGTLSGTIYDARGLFTDKAGQDIVVTYKAYINADAIVGQEIPNNATVDYFTSPDGTQTGTSVPDVTYQYDFGFKLKKTDGTEHKNPLAGAVFQLRHTAMGDPIELVKKSEGVYRSALASDVDKVTKVTTGIDGTIVFEGLAAGDYYLVETAAPEGYNKLAKPIKIAITDTTTSGTNPTWQIKVNDAQDVLNGSSAKLPEVAVENNKGALLPETGGMGTILFTLVGAAAIGYGIYRKRTAKTVA